MTASVMIKHPVNQRFKNWQPSQNAGNMVGIFSWKAWRNKWLLVLLVALVSNAQGQHKSFQKEYETKAFTHCYDIVSTSDGGYLLTGLEDVPSNPASVTTPYLLKLDCNGDPEWKRKYAQTSALNNLNHKVTALDDSNYIFLTSEGVTSSFDILVTSVDINGNTNWIFEYGGAASDIPGNVVVLSDGNIAITGATNSYGNNAFTFNFDIYVVKIDASNGSILWSKTFGIPGANSRGYDLVENEVGGVTVIGTTFDAASVATWTPMISLDFNGNMYDQRYFGLPDRNTIGLSISRAKDGGFIVSGSSNFLGLDWFDSRQFPYVVKTTQNKQIEWTRILEGFPNASGLGGIAYTPVDNGDTIGVAIETYYYQNTTQDPTKRILALLQENNGAMIDVRQYNSEGGQFPTLDYDLDGGYIMSAMTDENNGSGPNDQWWIGPIINKLDKDFNSGCNETNRNQVTTAHDVTFTVDTNLSLSDSFGAAQLPIIAGSDSIVFSYPVVETFCESKHQVSGSLLTTELSCGDTSGLFVVDINYPLFDLTWDFGDGTTVNSGNVDSVTHGYSNPGPYPINITVVMCDTTFTIEDTVVVLTGLPDTVIVPPYSFCENDSAVFLNSIVPNGVWSGTGIIDNATGLFSPAVAGLGSHEIIYDINTGACQGSDTATISVIEPPSVSLGSDTTICVGDSLALALDETYDSYLWSNGTGLSSTFVQEGTHWVQISLDGCAASDTISVSSASRPEFDLGPDTVLCEGESILLSAQVSGNVLYEWSTGSTEPEIVADVDGEYALTVSRDGCSITDVFSLTIIRIPTSLLGSDTVICSDELWLLDASLSGATYEWQDGSTSSFIEATPGDFYTVTVTLNDCEGVSEIFLDSKHCGPPILEIPNVFTPNGDGINDVLQPIEIGGISTMQTTVFNRWGNRVFETDDIDINWDGTRGGRVVADGVYYVWLTYEDVNGETGTIKTDVTVLSDE